MKVKQRQAELEARVAELDAALAAAAAQQSNSTEEPQQQQHASADAGREVQDLQAQLAKVGADQQVKLGACQGQRLHPSVLLPNP